MAKFIEFWAKVKDDDGKTYLYPVTGEEVQAVLKGLTDDKESTKKDWTKKCTCENFQQNEDCEHIGNKVLEKVGLGAGEKDCPDCLPYDGCEKHYIKNGDRHNR